MMIFGSFYFIAPSFFFSTPYFRCIQSSISTQSILIPGLKYSVPESPLITVIVNTCHELVLCVNALAGTSHVSMTLFPRYVPTVRLRVEAWFVTAVTLEDHELTVILGRPLM